MPSRAFHHKVRHGCIVCKQRRKKCDLKRPCCGGCIKGRRACTYGDTDVTSFWQEPSAVGTMHPLLRGVNSLDIPHVSTGEMSLLHHFMYATSSPFSTVPGISTMVRLRDARMAAQHPYLLYGVLAVSALHLRHLAATTGEVNKVFYTEKASMYQQLALSSYIPRVDTIDNKTYFQIFEFALIIVCLKLGSIHIPTTFHLPDADAYLTDIISVLDLLLGAVVIADTSGSWIPKCRFMSQQLRPEETLQSTYCSPNSDPIFSLEEQILIAQRTESLRSSQRVDDHQLSVIYNSAIPELLNVYKSLRRPFPDNFRSVIGWAAFIDKAFSSLLKQRHPAALVVLAHYGVALHALDDAWWLHGVGSSLVKSVASIIHKRHGHEWQAVLQWPLEKIEQPPQSFAQKRAPQSSVLLLEKSLTCGPPKVFETALFYTYRDTGPIFE